VAVGFEQAREQNFFEKQLAAYKERREVFLKGLDAVGLPYTIPEGSYFVLVQNESIRIPEDFVIPDMVRDYLHSGEAGLARLLLDRGQLTSKNMYRS
jgi:kynurenine aminotransferase